MLCLINASSDEKSSCILGGFHTRCATYKCFLTVGKTCTRNAHEANLTGRECGKTLFCGNYYTDSFYRIIKDFTSLKDVITNVMAA